MACETLSQDQILDMMADFVDCARRIKELKDTLLYSNFFATAEEEERLWLECRVYDETMQEIERLQQEMLLLLDRVAGFLGAHSDLVQQVCQTRAQEHCQAA